MITTAPELIYMLKVNIGIALFYAFYKLFCCRDTFFQWRRIALLSFLALSFLLWKIIKAPLSCLAILMRGMNIA